MLGLLLLTTATSSQSGEEACENQNLDSTQCAAVGCCEYEDGQCWSSVGSAACDGSGGDGGGTGALLPGVVGWANGAVVWSDPPSGWSACAKVTTVFGVAVCVTANAWATSQAKCSHVAHVFYQLLDNDADGQVDDPAVVRYMIDGSYLLFVPATEGETDNLSPPDGVGTSQMTGIWEAFPNSCDVPTNRGASGTDRSTWAAATDTASLGCDASRDATTEEVLHLITEAASRVYPSTWGSSFASAAGAAIQAANGDCGWGFSGNWIDPSSSGCTGQYAYDDNTCDERCIVVEGIYWASVSYVGGLYTRARAASVQNEWLMPTPDTSMAVEPSGVANARSLQAGAPTLYALVADTTSEGHAWLPAIMPDGAYAATPNATSAGAGGGGGEAGGGGGDQDSGAAHVAASALPLSLAAATVLWAAAWSAI